MIDVLFLSPPRRSDGSRYLFNNATLALASYLAQNGREVRVEPLVGTDWRERLERALAYWKPRWAAISCKWWDTVYGATEVARYIRENHPDVRLVTGGQTATSFAEELIHKTAFDAVITGDAEVPLLQLVQGDPRCNVVLRDGTQTRRLPHSYVQPRTGGEKLALLPNLGEIAPPELLFHAGYTAPFIWTGKGCQSACTFCSGSAFGHKKLFGRTGFQYRPLEHTLADMEALAPWTQNTVMFDFDPVADPGRESYYLELARQLPKRRYHAAFYAWSLPTKEFIQQVSENFASVLVSLDAQTYSEPLRKRLSAKNQLKPFASDLEILDTLDFIRRFDNVHGVVYGILGLQTETSYDVERAESLMSYIQDAYHDVLQPNGVHVTPLAMEPDSLMDRNPEKYGMRRLRHGFDDYLEFTRLRFHALHEEVFQAAYREDEPHPYGVHQATDEPSRVHQDFSRIHAKITEKAHRWEGDKAVDSLRITPEEVRLDLKSRTIFHDDWRLVVWACSQARATGAPRVVVDTTQAHVKVPPEACFPFDEQFAWAGAEWDQLKAARQRGELELQLVGGPTTHWGFLMEQPG